MSGTFGTGLTISYGFCPGCRALHRTSDCPDHRPREGDYCVCCEAIAAAAALSPAPPVPGRLTNPSKEEPR